MRGTMLWFNEAEHHGMIEAEDGERLTVARSAFTVAAPEGRCSGLPVEFEIAGEGDQRRAESVSLVPPEAQRRARHRRPRH